MLEASRILAGEGSELIRQLEVQDSASLRLQLKETQHRQNAALVLQAETLRRLEVAIRQLSEAERLMVAAAARAGGSGPPGSYGDRGLSGRP